MKSKNKFKQPYVPARTAVIVTPKQPFINWACRTESKMWGFDHDLDPDLYLLPELEDFPDMQEWMEQNFVRIFQNKMFRAHQEEERWEQNLTFEKFGEWFNYELYPLIWDMVDTPVSKAQP